MELRNRLASVRREAGLSQVQLAQALRARGFDVKAYTVCRWESGASKPSVEAFLAVCDACRVADIRQAFAERRLLRLYDAPVSAGSGLYLDGDDYTMIEADDLTPAAADYAVRVSGDSMSPRFVDRQIIFISAQPTLEDGEIGVVCLNGDAYLKKLGRGCLLSLHPAYAPIPIRAHDSFTILGKVVG